MKHKGRHHYKNIVDKLYLETKPNLKIPILPGMLFLVVMLSGVIGYSILWKDLNVSPYQSNTLPV